MKNEIYQLREIAPQVYQIEEYGSFCYLIEGSRRALLIDTGTGFGDLAEFVRTITEKPLSVAATHAHPDHIGGRGNFPLLYLPAKEKKLARFYGSLFMRRLMFGKKAQEKYGKKRKDIRRGKYRTKYSFLCDGDLFELGDKTVYCMETPGHTKGGMIFLLRENKLLFSGDNVCRALWMFLPGSLTVEEWIPGAEKTLALLSEYTAYSGHDLMPLNKELIGKLIATAKALVSKKRNTLLPRIKVYPENYTDHGILYNTRKVRTKKKVKNKKQNT